MNNMTPMTYMARADFGGPVLMSATDVYTYLGISKSFFFQSHPQATIVSSAS